MTDKTSTKKWSDEAVATLNSLVEKTGTVSVASVEAAATALKVSARSVAAKLRQLDREVASMAKEKVAAFTADEGTALTAFVKSNDGQLTYKEIAEQFESGKFNAKQIQGKLLALELTASVKPAEKVEAARTYTADEETKFIALVNGGSYIEDIATSLSKSIASVRGKALSLTRSGQIANIPKQKTSHAATHTDPVEALGTAISTMTVAAIAKAVDKTDRGIKTLLTRRGINVADYKGAEKKAKAEAKSAPATKTA